ncbi:MAG: tetratricopeptide repeat protein, partial [Thermodesulfobacteriota bacterium]
MLPYFLTASLYMLLRTYALGGVMQMKQVELTRYDAVINVFPLIARYTGKLLLPVNLSAVYSYDIAHSITEPGVIVGLLTASAIIAVLFLLRKKTRVFLFLCWIFVPLLPVLYIPAVSVGGFADRYLYLSTAGFGVILGVAALRILSRAVKGGDLRGEKSRKTTIAVTATAAGLLIIYSIASVERSRVWRNDYSLWSDAVIKSPGSAGAYNNLGFAQTERGEVDEAIKSLRRAIELNRDSPGAYNNLGVALFHRKRYAEAMKNYRRAAELNPDNAEALSNIAEVLVILDRPEEALGYVNKALELSPGFADGHRVLGTAYAKLGRSRQAVEEFTVAIRINPDFAEAYNDLGETFLTMGRDEDAARAFEEAVRIDPSNGEFRKNLARAGRPGGLSVP